MTKTLKRSSDLANGETSEGDPPTSRDSVANARDRCDEEGRAPAVQWPFAEMPKAIAGNGVRMILVENARASPAISSCRRLASGFAGAWG
jgi:hypothetical protein